MHSLKIWSGVLAVLVGCSGSDNGDQTSRDPVIRAGGQDNFMIVETGAGDCSAERVADASKLSPPKADLAARLGTTAGEFIVLMDQEVSLEAYPLPADRAAGGEGNALYQARTAEIARSQGCTLDVVAKEGGRYVRSLLLINAFVAELTAEQALLVSELPGVRSVKLSQSGESPNGTNKVDQVSREPIVQAKGEDSFLIVDAGVEDCSAKRIADASKLSPPKADLAARLGTTAGEFIVLMDQEVSLEAYPLPADRAAGGEGNALYQARTAEIARSQGCTLSAMASGGGRYVHSFLLINAFVAELTVEQALLVSELPGVRSVKLSQSGESPF